MRKIRKILIVNFMSIPVTNSISYATWYFLLHLLHLTLYRSNGAAVRKTILLQSDRWFLSVSVVALWFHSQELSVASFIRFRIVSRSIPCGLYALKWNESAHSQTRQRIQPNRDNSLNSHTHTKKKKRKEIHISLSIDNKLYTMGDKF